MRRTSSLTTCCIGELYKEVRDFIIGQGTFLCPDGAAAASLQIGLYFFGLLFLKKERNGRNR